MPLRGLRSVCVVVALAAVACSAAPVPTGTGTAGPPSATAGAATSAATSTSLAGASSSPVADGATPGAPTADASAPASPSAFSATWSSVGPHDGAAPAAREDHTWTAAPDDAAYLFGGRDGATVYGDLWRFDLRTDAWTRLTPAGAKPAGRFGHTATWVEGVGLVVWSGQAGPRFFDDLWAYAPEEDAWRRLPNRGERPEARYGSCASLGPDGRLWISHGFTADSGRFSDTRAYDFRRGEWTDETPEGAVPARRCLHDCLWTPDGDLVLYGGQTTGVEAIGDVWALSPLPDGGWSWDELRPALPEKPAARNLYATTSIDRELYVFGGTAADGTKLADLWVLDMSEAGPVWFEAELPDRPPARSGATLVADGARGRILLFGGDTASGAVDDTWQLSFG